MKLIIFFALLLLLTSAAAHTHKSRSKHESKPHHADSNENKETVSKKLNAHKQQMSLAMTASDLMSSMDCEIPELQEEFDQTCGTSYIVPYFPLDVC
jgi:hypothetical protein